MLVWPIAAIILGLAVLVWGSDRFVNGAAAIAHNFGVPHILIGVTIVSLGTSAPEILVSVNAAMTNAVDLAMGNALGSNVANIGLVLAITALIAPLPISKRVMKVENGILVMVTLTAGWILYDAHLSRTDGILLLTLLIAFLVWIYTDSKSHPHPEIEEEIPTQISNKYAFVWFLVGLLALIGGARAMVWGATDIARTYNISELVIGATILAVGTSLPELAASVTSAMKKHHDIALGNILGSNIFNILAVISVPGLLNPGNISPDVFSRDYLFVLGITLLLAAGLILRGRNGKNLGKLFSVFAGSTYLVYLYMNYLAVV